MHLIARVCPHGGIGLEKYAFDADKSLIGKSMEIIYWKFDQFDDNYNSLSIHCGAD